MSHVMGRSGPSTGPISHGICPPCATLLFADLGVPLRKFLDTLDAPVMLVDVSRGARVDDANAAALDATDTTHDGIRDQLLGEVFECANAALPDGCGHTVHCSGCVIRNTVEATWRTGEPSVRRSATLRPRGQDDDRVAELEISTERVGDRVLLRIDRLSRPPRPDD